MPMSSDNDCSDILTPDTIDSPPINVREATVDKTHDTLTLKTARVGLKDYKKSGNALRGKNVTEAFRVKEKDLKRSMK